MKFLLPLLLALGTTLVQAQDFTIPTVDYSDEASYRAQEQNVVDAVDYLINNPVNRKPAKRQAVNSYLLEWVTGTPTMTISLSQEVAPFMECGDCLLLYMGAYAKETIVNAGGSVADHNVAAVNTVLDFYEKERAALGKNKEAEKFLKLRKKGKLEARIRAAS